MIRSLLGIILRQKLRDFCVRVLQRIKLRAADIITLQATTIMLLLIFFGNT